MRLISAIFSTEELQGYSDEEFERLVWQAKLRRADAIWVIPLLVGVIAGAAWIAAAVAMGVGMRSAGAPMGGPIQERWIVINGVVALTIAIAAGAMVRWRMIVTSIKRIVNKAACPFCEFSLVGLPVKSGWVICPECGQRVFLFEHRLTPEDLVPESVRNGPMEGAGERGAYEAPPERKPRQRRVSQSVITAPRKK